MSSRSGSSWTSGSACSTSTAGSSAGAPALALADAAGRPARDAGQPGRLAESPRQRLSTVGSAGRGPHARRARGTARRRGDEPGRAPGVPACVPAAGSRGRARVADCRLARALDERQGDGRSARGGPVVGRSTVPRVDPGREECRSATHRGPTPRAVAVVGVRLPRRGQSARRAQGPAQPEPSAGGSGRSAIRRDGGRRVRRAGPPVGRWPGAIAGGTSVRRPRLAYPTRRPATLVGVAGDPGHEAVIREFAAMSPKGYGAPAGTAALASAAALHRDANFAATLIETRRGGLGSGGDDLWPWFRTGISSVLPSRRFGRRAVSRARLPRFAHSTASGPASAIATDRRRVIAWVGRLAAGRLRGRRSGGSGPSPPTARFELFFPSLITGSSRADADRRDIFITIADAHGDVSPRPRWTKPKEHMTDAVLREHAEHAVRRRAGRARRRRRPARGRRGWRLSPWAVVTYLLGGTLPTAPRSRPKYVGPRRLIEVAVATLATDRALLLLGVPGTAKTWVSEHLAAAISGDSTLLVQGTAGTAEEAIRYGWNYARLLAEGPSPRRAGAEPGDAGDARRARSPGSRSSPASRPTCRTR